MSVVDCGYNNLYCLLMCFVAGVCFNALKAQNYMLSHRHVDGMWPRAIVLFEFLSKSVHWQIVFHSGDTLMLSPCATLRSIQ